MLYGETGRGSLNTQVVVRSEFLCFESGEPFATASYSDGAVIVNVTLAFADPPIPCLIGARATASCPPRFESCEQRQQGAFGPNGGGVTTISLQGAAGGPLVVGAPVDATLASVFCIPLVAGDVVNNNVSLPGPAALTLPVHITAE